MQLMNIATELLASSSASSIGLEQQGALWLHYQIHYLDPACGRGYAKRLHFYLTYPVVLDPR